MALNEQQQPGNVFVATLAGIASGAPANVGQFTGVAPVGSVTIDGVANQCVIDMSHKYWNLSVKGVTNGAVSAAVAVGDQLYINLAHTPAIDKDTTGVPFGIAAGAVASGATTTISVRHGAI